MFTRHLEIQRQREANTVNLLGTHYVNVSVSNTFITVRYINLINRSTAVIL